MGIISSHSITTDIASGELNASKLHKEIDAASVVSNLEGIYSEEDDIFILGDSVLDQSTLDSVIQNHVACSLDDKKASRITEIDLRTQELISEGFTFDTKQFSLSQPAQINWIGLKSLETLITWPLDITTKDDGAYELVQANLSAFVGTAAGTVQAHLDSGRNLKVAIINALDEAAVDAVGDTR